MTHGVSGATLVAMDEDLYPVRGLARGLGRLVLIAGGAALIALAGIGTAAFVVVKTVT